MSLGHKRNWLLRLSWVAFLVGGLWLIFTSPDTPEDRIDPIRYRNSRRHLFASSSLLAISIVGLVTSTFVMKKSPAIKRDD